MEPYAWIRNTRILVLCIVLTGMIAAAECTGFSAEGDQATDTLAPGVCYLHEGQPWPVQV